MTPGAHAAAAIEALDAILAGTPAEPALARWARSHRFAGSSDRAAIRDLVFDALRRRRSAAARGGSDTGRGLVLGLLREAGAEDLFSGEGHAPTPATSDEDRRLPEGNAALDCPDWIAPSLKSSLGPDFAATMSALRTRAPVFLRANLARATRAAAQSALVADGISAQFVAGSETALEVTSNSRKIQSSRAYTDGLVELQDLSSQSLCEALPLTPGQRVLDHCAGGGGKSLAIAARAPVTLFAHDANPRRLKDLPPRAARADAAITIIENPAREAPFDLILADVPCSGSGSWRRDPEGKWRLTRDGLDRVVSTQAEILDTISEWLAPNGTIAYATCSLLAEENEAQVESFLARHPGWDCRQTRRWSPLSGGDGFFLALLTRIHGVSIQP